MTKKAFKNNAPFINCIIEINNTLIGNAVNLDIVMPVYNLIEYNKNYSKTLGSLWNYFRIETNSGAVENINYSIKDSKSFNDKKVLQEDCKITMYKKKMLKLLYH